MERNNSLSNNLKNHSINNKVTDSWQISSMDSTAGGDLLGGFSWPPRSYTCTFCKREFRSAQALGGHMNVHRRERARLRQSPPRESHFSNNLLNFNLDPNPNPNPNPNFSSSSHPSSPPTMFPPFTSKLPALVSPSLSSSASPSEFGKLGAVMRSKLNHHLCPRGGNLTKMKSQKTLFGIGGFDAFSHENEGKFVKNTEIVRLNLEIGLLSESKVDDLDLELRLGYS